jgi:hypothetical protein
MKLMARIIDLLKGKYTRKMQITDLPLKQRIHVIALHKGKQTGGIHGQ